MTRMLGPTRVTPWRVIARSGMPSRTWPHHWHRTRSHLPRHQPWPSGQYDHQGTPQIDAELRRHSRGAMRPVEPSRHHL